MKKWLASALLVSLLAGCASGVKLDDVPVEDKAATSQSNALGDGQNGVNTVDANAARAGMGPVNTAHVVYFDFDSFVVKAEARPVIEAHAKFLQANAQRKVMLQGHTDERGGREYNLALGQKRAEAVRRSLNLLGVSDSQVEAVSFGEEKPAAAGSNEAAYSQNRRAEISYR